MRGYEKVTLADLQRRSSAKPVIHRKVAAPRVPSHLEALIVRYLKAVGHPMPEQEFEFHQERKWRADFAWPDRKLLLEVEGGTFKQGRHNRPQGMRDDAEKYNAATLLGWRVLRVTGDMVTDGTAYDVIDQALRGTK